MLIGSSTQQKQFSLLLNTHTYIYEYSSKPYIGMCKAPMLTNAYYFGEDNAMPFM